MEWKCTVNWAETRGTPVRTFCFSVLGSLISHTFQIKTIRNQYIGSKPLNINYRYNRDYLKYGVLWGTEQSAFTAICPIYIRYILCVCCYCYHGRWCFLQKRERKRECQDYLSCLFQYGMRTIPLDPKWVFHHNGLMQEALNYVCSI